MSYESSTLRATDQERQASDRHVLRAVAAVLALIAVSLAVAAVRHLTGQVRGRAKPFDSSDAGIAEAIIGTFLASGSTAMFRDVGRVRTIGLAVTTFAIMGFVIGLTITIQAGHLPDVAYHITVLPLLLGSLTILIRATGP
jgi:hypothetical protein